MKRCTQGGDPSHGTYHESPQFFWCIGCRRSALWRPGEFILSGGIRVRFKTTKLSLGTQIPTASLRKKRLISNRGPGVIVLSNGAYCMLFIMTEDGTCS